MTKLKGIHRLKESLFSEYIESYNILIKDSSNSKEIKEAAQNLDLLLDLIKEYRFKTIDGMETDDEIINWTFTDVKEDLKSALWNLCCASYKTSASCLRNAFEMSFVSLYFTIREHENHKKGVNNDTFNQFFLDWDSGNKDTPNWGEMMPVINKNTHLKNFNTENNCDLMRETYSWFKHLCSFTHGRSFNKALLDSDVLPTNHANIGTNFTEKNFERFLSDFNITVSLIGSFWALCFPEILEDSKYETIFCSLQAAKILYYIQDRKNK